MTSSPSSPDCPAPTFAILIRSANLDSAAAQTGGPWVPDRPETPAVEAITVHELAAAMATRSAEVVDLATKRQEARSSGDFAEADRLRGEIADRGWTVRDVAEGFQLVRSTRAA